MTLYLISTNYGEFYVIGENPTAACNILTATITKKYRFSTPAKITNIKIIGEIFESNTAIFKTI